MAFSSWEVDAINSPMSSNSTFEMDNPRGAFLLSGAGTDERAEVRDWKQHVSMGWERLQESTSGSKQQNSVKTGNNKVNSSLCAKSKSAPFTHNTNNSQLQTNRRLIHLVKKPPRYHLHRRHNVKYWYEEPKVGMVPVTGDMDGPSKILVKERIPSHLIAESNDGSIVVQDNV